MNWQPGSAKSRKVAWAADGQGVRNPAKKQLNTTEAFDSRVDSGKRVQTRLLILEQFAHSRFLFHEGVCVVVEIKLEPGHQSRRRFQFKAGR